MGFIRFFRRIRIAPGLRLNLSKRGMSLSAGVRGAEATFSRDGLRTTVGLPGTGLSYTAKERWLSRSGPVFGQMPTADRVVQTFLQQVLASAPCADGVADPYSHFLNGFKVGMRGTSSGPTRPQIFGPPLRKSGITNGRWCTATLGGPRCFS